MTETGNDPTALIAAVVAIVLSVSTGILNWATWRRDSTAAATERADKLNTIKHEMEEDLWVRVKGQLDAQDEKIAELQVQIRERDQKIAGQDEEITKLRDELDIAYARIRALENENRKLKQQVNGKS